MLPRRKWVLALLGVARAAAPYKLGLSRQSRLRTTVRTAKAATTIASAAIAALRWRAASQLQNTASSRQKPAEGRYARRSPMMVPVRIRIFEVAANPAK